jgi:hypothetical protein
MTIEKGRRMMRCDAHPANQEAQDTEMATMQGESVKSRGGASAGAGVPVAKNGGNLGSDGP